MRRRMVIPPNNIAALIAHNIGPSKKFRSSRQFARAASLYDRDATKIIDTGEVDYPRLRKIADVLEANILDLFLAAGWVTISDIYGEVEPQLEKALTIWHLLPLAERRQWIQSGRALHRIMTTNQEILKLNQEAIALPSENNRSTVLTIWSSLPSDMRSGWLESGEGLLRLLGMMINQVRR
jgi:hypothetical protein